MKSILYILLVLICVFCDPPSQTPIQQCQAVRNISSMWNDYFESLPAGVRVFAKHIAIPAVKDSLKQLRAQLVQQKIEGKQAKARVKAAFLEKLKQKKANPNLYDSKENKQIQRQIK